MRRQRTKRSGQFELSAWAGVRRAGGRIIVCDTLRSETPQGEQP